MTGDRRPTMLEDLLRPEDRAVEAVVARYQRVAPAITRFARSLSGNQELLVRLGSEPASSPTEIVCDPRVFQAAYNRNAPVTPDEVALASALHEVVHLVSTDLDERRPIPGDWPRITEGPLPEEDLDLLTALERAGGPVSETFFFALEDARQECQGLSVYPGARSVLADLYRAAFPAAVSKSGPLSQFALGCFLIVGDYLDRSVLEKRFEARASVALDDATELLREASDASDPWEVAGIALKLTAIAKAHGLLTEPPPQSTPSQRRSLEKHDADQAAEGVDSVRLLSPVLQDSESYQHTRRAAQARSGESDRKGAAETAQDESTDQLLRVSQAPRVYLPTGQSGPLIVTSVPDTFAGFAADGRQALTEAAARWGVAQRHVSGELFPLFVANQRRGLRSGYDQGDISPHAALFIGAGLYQRLYERRAARTRRTYAVSLLVDASASMLMSRPVSGGQGREAAITRPWGMSAALLGAWTLARLADELQIDFEVALFNRGFAARPGDSEWSYSRSRSAATAGLRRTQGAAADRLTATVNHYLVKPFDRRWREAEDVLAGLFWTAAEPRAAAAAARRNPRETAPVSMFEKASNVDEFNVVHAAERMARLGADVRVLVVLADGMTRGSVQALRSAVSAVESSGTTVLGIGIGDDTVDNAYRRAEVVERPEQLTNAMVEGTRSALRRSLALQGLDTWWIRSSRAIRKEAS
ncbi:MAG TPA: hypothetical protein VK011_00210 [Acidimicrobiia bacterium]|nr:hypothetical protein [Acidimicrobiia bacterium]